MNLYLDIHLKHDLCHFWLTCGEGQRQSDTLPYPTSLSALYHLWRDRYLDFYQHLSLPPIIGNRSRPDQAIPLRGQVEASGSASSVEDRRSQLVQAEARLLAEFHRWLSSAQLFELRRQMVRAIADHRETSPEPTQAIYLFLTCSPIELERLPWESWEINAEFDPKTPIQIVRTATKITANPPVVQRRKPRILAILGDDTGLNFEAERRATQSLSRLATVEFVGWQQQQGTSHLLNQIATRLDDEQGWDVLLFAGHSNETDCGGGELAIAPGQSIFLDEIAPYLRRAHQRGLQFALFNSCNGLSIAHTLIELGLSQVVVMREPIHNHVAQTFITSFLQHLSTHKDVHESLFAVCQEFKLKNHLTYPSVHLVPSMFCHPAATPFKLERTGLREWLIPWIPTRQQAIVLAACLSMAVLPPVQDYLLDRRLWLQAIYRNVTHQLPTTAPPVTVVQIDAESIRQAGLTQIHPMDRHYLAQLVDQLVALDAPIIGIDYLLDTPQPPNDALLGHAIRRAIARHSTWFVFSARLGPRGEVGINPNLGIADPAWSMQGFVNTTQAHRIMLLYPEETCSQLCPFPYLLALLRNAHDEIPAVAALPQHHLTQAAPPSIDLRQALLAQIVQQRSPSLQIQNLATLRWFPITARAYETLGLLWLMPLIDFSIPPQQVYRVITAQELLTASPDRLPNLSQQIIIIAAGEYDQAGLVEGQGDSSPAPLAIRYWRNQKDNGADGSSNEEVVFPSLVLTGGEELAYTTHHMLNQRLVIPIPDLWMVGIAAAIANRWSLSQRKRPSYLTPVQRIRLATTLSGITLVYGLITVQLYISTAILLPWFLPSLLVWLYLLPPKRLKKYA